MLIFIFKRKYLNLLSRFKEKRKFIVKRILIFYIFNSRICYVGFVFERVNIFMFYILGKVYGIVRFVECIKEWFLFIFCFVCIYLCG